MRVYSLNSYLGLAAEQNGLMQSLFLLTDLHAEPPSRGFRANEQNCQVAKEIISLAAHRPQLIRAGWKQVLEVISQLDKHQLLNRSMSQTARNGQEVLPRSCLVEMELIEQIFYSSVRLDGESIANFVHALCQTSKREIREPKFRIFSLQRIVEVAELNMG